MIEPIPLGNYYNPYQYKDVPPKGKKLIYSFKPFEHNLVAFINKIALKWYPNTLYILEFDMERVLGTEIKHSIGDIKQPEEYDPPFLVKSSINVWMINNDTTAHTAEVFIDGDLYSIRN